MAEGKFVSYLRVSTKRQGDSGLGLEAQRKAVTNFLNGGRWDLIDERIEVESGKSDTNRPELERALKLCRLHSATLVIAKLDRLSRDAHFLLGLQKAGVKFVAADMPEANEMVVGIMAVVAQAERKMISTRTKAALAQKRAYYAKLSDEDRTKLLADGKAVQLGGDRGAVLTDTIRAKGVAVRQERSVARARDLAADIAEIQAGGAVSLREIAAGLNTRGIPTARGGTWSAVQVKRVLERAA
jgi:DNA invertase Pin-like site-specific DNA recombinase